MSSPMEESSTERTSPVEGRGGLSDASFFLTKLERSTAPRRAGPRWASLTINLFCADHTVGVPEDSDSLF